MMKTLSWLLHSLFALALAASVSAAPTVSAPAATGALHPRVGIIYTRQQAKALAAGNDKLKNYVRAITENGGTTCDLSPALSAAQTAERAKSLDALLVPGGNDVDPALYHEKPDKRLEQIDPEFDHYVGEIVSQAAVRRIPILGICRGEQFLNVWAGGTLWQDLSSRPPSSTNVVHRLERAPGDALPCYHHVTLKEGSFLFRLFKTTRLKVNSYHHQGVKALAPRFHAAAWADDGLVEAFEDDKGRITAVQFHPEIERLQVPAFNAVFTDFLSRAAQPH